MARYTFYTLDVFTDRIFGGNPLAVFPDGSGLDTEQMQAVAREFNISETVFVLPPDRPDHTRKLRIFTPGTELPFAGHPTIGTAHLLSTIGEILLEGPETQIVFEEGVGPVPVTIYGTDGNPTQAQLSAAQMPETGALPPSNADLAEVLSLNEDDILVDPAPNAVSCGVGFLFIMLKDIDALARAQLRHEAWERLLSDYWAPHPYLLTPSGSFGVGGPDSKYQVRMFAPAMGIVEDPATGAAATALAGYLAPLLALKNGTAFWSVDQGVEMGRPSRLEIEADISKGVITGIRVSGNSVMVSQGEMEIPDPM
jgi:trans-2,3-dihydro-3-hydroxyanthranilate isomerase